MERGGYGNGNNRGRGRGRGRNNGRGFQPSQKQHRPTNVTVATSTQTHNHIQTLPDIGSLNVSDQAEKRMTMIKPLRRPDRGGTVAVRSCKLRVNHFLVNFNPRGMIMHYNVDVKAESARVKKISKFDLAMIRDKLFLDHPLPPITMTAYDGEKSLYSAVPLPEETFAVDVSKGEDEKVVSYVVTLKLVNVLEFGRLRDYLNGRELSIPREILQGMDLVMKENPTRRCVSLGRCFFPMNAPEGDWKDLEPGVIAIRGFQQGLMATAQGLALRLDPSVLSFKEKMPVLDFLGARIKNFNLNEFWKFKREVERVLVGLKVHVTHRRTKQKYTVAGLTPKATRHTTFPVLDADGKNPRNASLLAYFRDRYGYDIQYKDIPALDFGGNKTNYMPMELCVLVEGQRFPKEQLRGWAAKALKDMSLAYPKVRATAIQNMVISSDGPTGGGIIQNFGMDVLTSMTSVTGRVLMPPVLKLGDSRGRITSMSLDHEKCQWNLVGKSMVEGKPVECWGILDFTSNEGPRGCKLRGDKFIQNLIGKYRKLGIHMEQPVCYEESAMWKLGNYNLLFELLEKINENVQKKCRRRLQFLLCVMADKDQGYKCLKWIAETKVGIVTQCCLSPNANEAKDQYLTNLALKINAKIGGSNVELINRLPHFEGEGHVMFIGADVNHPGSRDTDSPSIAAVVATVNWPAANRYAARVCVQHHRTEEILNFGNLCVDLVTYYNRVNKVRPEKIVIFRDGVSESQFLMVLTKELEDLKEEFGRINYFPTITLIVAQKRHQTRLFPTGMKEGTPNGNVYPGTVVDTKVVHPFEFDFYLCSHYGSLGTSKPTHYHVLWDEHKFTSDDLQKLIYDMCFTFARCTKPVSLVPPVYYADLAAYRGRLYYEAKAWAQSPDSGASSSSSRTTASSSLSSTASGSVDLGPYQLHIDVENVMFFV